MSKEDQVELAGVVSAIPGGGLARVTVTGENGLNFDVIAVLSGKMKQFKIRVVVGDKVKVAVSPYDHSKGRITYRERS